MYLVDTESTSSPHEFLIDLFANCDSFSFWRGHIANLLCELGRDVTNGHYGRSSSSSDQAEMMPFYCTTDDVIQGGIKHIHKRLQQDAESIRCSLQVQESET
jgi:hypothetical protein